MRYDPLSQSTIDFNYDGSAQSISVDEYNNVIYWANYDANQNIFMVMKTLLNGQTFGLNITYVGAIELTSDVFNFYVLDRVNNRIDKYSKASLEKQGNITNYGRIHDLIIAYGEFHILPYTAISIKVVHEQSGKSRIRARKAAGNRFENSLIC